MDWNSLEYSMAPPGYRELRTDHVVVELPGIKYFLLTGKDALDWLQGQSTNDVRLLEEKPWLDFCLTRSTGQIQALCRAWKTPEGTVVATQQPDVLVARANDTVILEDVSLQPLGKDIVCVQGIETKRVDGSLFSDRTGSGGVEREPGDLHNAVTLSEAAYQLATIEAGIPLAGSDFGDKTLPPELGRHFESEYVSYTKGCYVGQEVLMRIKARGHTNKTWVGLTADALITEGKPVTSNGTEVGIVHRAALSPAFGHIATATLKNEAAKEGHKVEVDGVEATVTEMPFIKPLA